MDWNIMAMRQSLRPERRHTESERPVRAQVGCLAGSIRNYANGTQGAARPVGQGPRSVGLLPQLFTKDRTSWTSVHGSEVKRNNLTEGINHA